MCNILENEKKYRKYVMLIQWLEYSTTNVLGNNNTQELIKYTIRIIQFMKNRKNNIIIHV